MGLQPLVILNVVGLTPALLDHAPRMKALATGGRSSPMIGIFPAVTLPAQATMLTGAHPDEHGVVGNGWLWRETGEVRFWQQSNRLLLREALYDTARRIAHERGEAFTCAKLFWWFNEGARVDWSVTPKPHYGADGSKAFDIKSTPDGLSSELKQELGNFPFFSFWGPKAGLPSSRWIAAAAAKLMRKQRPTLTLVYLPHLDYDLQRLGERGADLPRLVREVDDCAGLVIDAARDTGARVLVVSEYGLCDVSRPVYVNRELRRTGLLAIRSGPFGEMLDTHESRAFAVCDHQAAHIYVRDAADLPRVCGALKDVAGVARLLSRSEQHELRIGHERAGDLVALSAPDAWFAYPYWLDDALAPDFARTVDIHRKPGYDPCELLLDPAIALPKLKVAGKLARKALGMRYLMDVIPLDATLVRGSHGLTGGNPQHGPIIACDAGNTWTGAPHMTDVKDIALRLLGLAP